MTKVISLSDEAYAEMKKIKGEGESFSKVVLRLIRKKNGKSLVDFFGKWPGGEKELTNIKKTLKTERKKFKTRDFHELLS